MDFASTSSKLISETGSLADLDIRDVDLDSANVEEHSQIMEVSVHQGPVEVTSAIIDVGRALTMDNLVPAQQCAMLLTSTHAPPLGSTSNTLFLAQSTSAAAPLLVPGLVSARNSRSNQRVYSVFRCARGAASAIQRHAERRGNAGCRITAYRYMPRPPAQHVLMQSEFEELASLR